MVELEDYIKKFDKAFKTNVLSKENIEKMKLIERLFKNFEYELYEPTEKYNKLRKHSISIYDKLEKTFTEEQQKLFEHYWEISNEASSEIEYQMFVYGFIIANELNRETTVL